MFRPSGRSRHTGIWFMNTLCRDKPQTPSLKTHCNFYMIFQTIYFQGNKFHGIGKTEEMETNKWTKREMRKYIILTKSFYSHFRLISAMFCRLELKTKNKERLAYNDPQWAAFSHLYWSILTISLWKVFTLKAATSTYMQVSGWHNDSLKNWRHWVFDRRQGMVLNIYCQLDRI